MNDNRPVFLVYDREQHFVTGLYTLITSDKKKSFTFESEAQAASFVDAFFRNRFVAIAVYEESTLR